MTTIHIIVRHNTDDYEISTQEVSDEQYKQFQSEGFSVRGTLAEVMTETFDETPRHTAELQNICDIKRRMDLYETINSCDKHLELLDHLYTAINISMKKPQ